MTQDWKEKRVEQCFKVKSGDFLPANKMVKKGSVDVYGGNGIAGKHDQHNLTGENIIIGRVGAKCGNIKRVTRNIWITDNAFYISKFIEDFDLRFLEYLLSTKNLRNTANQTAQPVISYATIKNVVLPIPPLPEQKQIVAILDEAFEGIDRAIANTEKNLTNARKLFEIYLNEIFTQKDVKWEKKKIDEIADVISGYSFKSEDFSDSHPLKSIKITNVGVREFIIESGNNLPETFAKTYDKFSVPKGSIVFALTRSIISGGLKVAVVPDDYHHALLNQRVAALKVNSHLMSEKFLFSYLCTQKAMAYVQSQVNTLMQPNLSINDLRRMIVPVPSLEEQNQIILRIAALSNKTQRLESLYRQKLTTLNELKQSILQKAFTGELTADIANQTIEAAERNQRISQDSLSSAETVKQNVHQSEQLSLWS